MEIIADKSETIAVFVIECSLSLGKDKLRERVVELKHHNNWSLITVNSLINAISESFNITKKIRIFDFLGFEIIEDSDLGNFKDCIEKHKIIFFVRVNEFFENKNLMRSIKITRKLGEGGFGKVYLAEQKFTQDNFAIKFFKYNFTSIKDLNFLYKEIEALRRLDHNNIIKLYTYCMLDDDKIALIMEYASGGTLKEYLKEKKYLNEDECRIIFKQILDTVHYCHTMGIIHRDLKLENIVFSDKTQKLIKIIDFGVSGLFKGEKSKAGSVKYMAPEVVNGSNFESLPNLDVWSLGCILYELLTGEVLFQGTKEEIKDKILKGKTVIPDDISMEAAHLINSMIKISAQERISISECMNHPWILSELLKDQAEINKLIEKRAKAHKIYKSRPHKLTISLEFNPNENNSLTPKPQNKCLYNINDHYLRSKSRRLVLRSKTTQKKEMNGELPSLITKIPNDFKESSMYDYNISLMRQFKGKIPNFLQPIGHNKDQKQKITKIKNLWNKYFELINTGEANSENSTNTSNNNEKKNRLKKSYDGLRINTANNNQDRNLNTESSNNFLKNSSEIFRKNKTNKTHIVKSTRDIPFVKRIDKSKNPTLNTVIYKPTPFTERLKLREEPKKIISHNNMEFIPSDNNICQTPVITPKSNSTKNNINLKQNPNIVIDGQMTKLSPIYHYPSSQNSYREEKNTKDDILSKR